MGVSLTAACKVEHAEAEVAMSDSRSHAELLGERERLQVERLSPPDVRWVGVGMNSPQALGTPGLRPSVLFSCRAKSRACLACCKASSSASRQ